MMRYENPILTGMYPDPSICRVGKDFYLVTSSFEYLPGIPVFHSRDLINWRQIGHALHRPEQLELPGAGYSKGIFAPTIRYHNGMFYVVSTTTSTSVRGESGNFFVTARNPAGPWSQPVFVAQDGIDPSLFFDDDGQVYFTSNRFGENYPRPVIQQSIIDIRTGQLLYTPRIISEGSGGCATEAPHLYKYKGWYYLVLAEGGTALGHMITVFRGTSPWGPFEPCPHNPILTSNDHPAAPLQGTGHADFVTDVEGNLWMVFLCYRIASSKYHHLGRETALLPVDMDGDDWPRPYNGRVASMIVHCPGVEVALPTSAPGLEWNFLRTYFHGYERHGDILTIIGNQHTLDACETPAFIARRQQHFACRIAVDVRLTSPEGGQAGLALRMGEEGHYDLLVENRGDKRVILLQKRVGDMRTQEITPAPEGEWLRLVILADREKYTFGYEVLGMLHPVGTGLTRLLSTEAYWGFVGVYVGMYVVGDGTRADFTQFKYCAK